MSNQSSDEFPVAIEADAVQLEGKLGIPDDAVGIVLFAHGSGSSRHSPRNNYVARQLREGGVGTLLFDLLTGEEEVIDRRTAELRFDIDLLARRLAAATKWLLDQDERRGLPLGYFGASTGAAAALKAAARGPAEVKTVVSRGGRPDLAGDALAHVKIPVLLIVGGNDTPVIEMNRDAMEKLASENTELNIVPGASHLFEEPGTLEQVADLAKDWFAKYLPE